MIWRSPLYLGDSVKPHAATIIADAKAGSYAKNLYLLTLAANGKDQLHLINTRHLLGKEAAMAHMPPVVGLAIGRDEAIAVLTRIAKEALAETGEVDLPAFLATVQTEDGERAREVPWES